MNWDEVGFVLGSRVDMTHSGLKRGCSDCGRAVFTSRRYPDDVRVLCEDCVPSQGQPASEVLVGVPFAIRYDPLTERYAVRYVGEKGWEEAGSFDEERAGLAGKRWPAFGAVFADAKR